MSRAERRRAEREKLREDAPVAEVLTQLRQNRVRTLRMIETAVGEVRKLEYLIAEAEALQSGAAAFERPEPSTELRSVVDRALSKRFIRTV